MSLYSADDTVISNIEAIVEEDFSGESPIGSESLRDVAALSWRIHLLRRAPQRLPALLLVFGIGMGCVWLMFGTVLPVLAALLLLVGSVSEYLFPIAYRLTEQEIRVEAATSRSVLLWKEARRSEWRRDTLLITSLVQPSRLDAFRGVVLRFAPEGEPGDRAAVSSMIAQHAPHLLPRAFPTSTAVPMPSTLPGMTESKAGMNDGSEEAPA